MDWPRAHCFCLTVWTCSISARFALWLCHSRSGFSSSAWHFPHQIEFSKDRSALQRCNWIIYFGTSLFINGWLCSCRWNHRCILATQGYNQTLSWGQLHGCLSLTLRSSGIYWCSRTILCLIEYCPLLYISQYVDNIRTSHQIRKTDLRTKPSNYPCKMHFNAR